MTRLVPAALFAAMFATAMTTPAHAQINVQIGIQLPGPPSLVVVPGTPVYYAPHAPANVFFYANQYWAFANGGWYVGPGWNGPWVVVAPASVPVPILHVPVGYYPVPPREWKGWRRDAPPRWDAHYGREWHEDAHEQRWREREEHWKSEGRGHEGGGRGCPPGLARQGRC